MVNEILKLIIGWIATIAGYFVNSVILQNALGNSSGDIGDGIYLYSILIGLMSAVYSLLLWRKIRNKRTAILALASSLLIIPALIIMFVLSMFIISAV